VARSGRGAVHLVKPRYERRELIRDPAGFFDGVSYFVGIGRRAATVVGHFAFDEAAERDADRCRTQAGAIGGPDLIAHLHSCHPVARSSSTFLGPMFTLSSSSAHVYVVDHVADALEE
jgi:hypothetical protein